MVLSLAFVLAFIGSAISLLFGILIFGEVSDSLFIDAPEVTPEESFTINGFWQYRESKTTGNNAFCSFNGSNVNQTIGSAFVLGTISSKVHDCYLFKIFPTEFLANTRIFVDWRGFDGGGLAPASRGIIQVLNHEYNRANFTEIPISGINLGLATESVTHIELYDDLACCSTAGFGRKINSVDWQPVDLTRPFSTIVITNNDRGGSEDVVVTVWSVNITDITTGATKAFYSYAGANQVHEVLSLTNDYGFITVAGFGEQVFVTQEAVFDEQAQDTFNSAKDTAWTVIGIIPVALFFILFALFSSFTNRQ